MTIWTEESLLVDQRILNCCYVSYNSSTLFTSAYMLPRRSSSSVRITLERPNSQEEAATSLLKKSWLRQKRAFCQRMVIYQSVHGTMERSTGSSKVLWIDLWGAMVSLVLLCSIFQWTTAPLSSFRSSACRLQDTRCYILLSILLFWKINSF